eukprot:748421-Hanusia_phi.AAC.2
MASPAPQPSFVLRGLKFKELCPSRCHCVRRPRSFGPLRPHLVVRSCPAPGVRRCRQGGWLEPSD